MLKSAQQALGLYRTPNQLGVAQEGAYVRLDECVIRSKDVVEPRLGHSLLSTYIGGNLNDTRRFNALFQSSVGYLGQYGSGTTSGVKVVDGASTEILTDVDPPSVWSRTKFADCQKRCYLTTDMGLKRINSSLTGAAAGGLLAKINTSYSRPVYSTSGFLAANAACLYRALLVSFAPDGAEIVGPASNRYYCRAPASQTIAIGSFVRNTNVITVTTPVAHGLRVGDTPNFTFDAADTGAGEFTTGAKTIATVPTSTTFTIAETAGNYTNTVAVAMAIGTAIPKVRVLLPSTASTSDMVRLYRSEATATVAATPSDDVYQVYEAYLTSANISAGYVEIDDNCPEVLLGNPAYFAPSVEGELASNEPPPLARDVCAVGDVLVLADLTHHHQLEIRLLATGGSSGISPASSGQLTITRSGYGFASASFTYGPLSDGNAAVYAGGTVARDIEATAIGICDAINTNTSNDWCDAFYISAADEAPGRILLRARDFTSTAFTATDANTPTAWAPNLPSTGTLHTSKQELDPAGIISSKPGQPDAFPLSNLQRCGASGERALRILPVREKVIALKEESAWLLSGPGPFRIDLLDDTCGFPLPDTAAVLDNQVFCLSTIGVVAVSEAGVAQYGSPIEGDTRAVSEQAGRVGKMIAAGYTPHCLASWGAADETEHRYLLAVPSALATPATTVAHEHLTDIVWCFNAGPRVWSGPFRGQWRHAHRWTSSSSSSRLAFALHNLPAIAKEQGLDAPEAQRYSDYFGRTVTAVYGNATFVDVVQGGDYTNDNIGVGDVLYYATTGFGATVTAVSSNGISVSVDDASGFYLLDPTVRVLKAYEAVAEWVPLHGGAFPSDKQLSGVVLTLSEERFVSAVVKVSSEVSGAELEAKTLSRPGFGADMARQSDGSDGDVGYGNEPFGHLSPLRRERCQVPRDVQSAGFHSVVFRVKEAGAFFRLHGLTLDFESSGVKGVR